MTSSQSPGQRLGRGLLAKQTRHLAASLVGALFNGGEVEPSGGTAIAEEFLCTPGKSAILLATAETGR